MKIYPFGFLLNQYELQSKHFFITPTDDCQSSIDEIKKDTDEHGWVFSPLPRVNRLFSLPKNHTIKGLFDSDEHAKFIIQCFSFFIGIKLSTGPNEYIDSVLLKHDLGCVLTKESLQHGLDAADVFWEKYKSSPQVIERVFGIIHILFLSKTKNLLMLEQFNYLYMALDSIYKHFVDVKSTHDGISHSKRPEIIAHITGVPFPDLFRDSDPGVSLSTARNYLIHEGLFNAKAIGYSMYKIQLLPFEKWIIQIIFSLLEIEAQGPFNCMDRQIIPVKIPAVSL